MKNRHSLRLPLLCAWNLLVAAVTGCSPDTVPDAEDIASPVDVSTTREALVQVDLRTYGAVCDGLRDERAAFQKAFTALSTAGGGTLLIPPGDCRVLTTAGVPWLNIPSNVTLRGVAGASRISMDADTTSNEAYRSLFSIGGKNVTLEDLELVRTATCSAMLIRLPPTSNFTMRRVTVDGGLTDGSIVAHGLIFLPGAADAIHSNLRLEQSTIRNTTYGWFQPGAYKTRVSGIVVTQSTFQGNFADDLEFNSPEGVMTDIEVSHSTFRDNRSTVNHAGFGIGLANVQRANLLNNTFEGYRFEPIHIEDRSREITVAGNTFARSYTESTSWSSHVFIINDSHDITVRGNVFDMGANTHPIHAIFAGHGGSGINPSNILIEQNTFVPGTYGKKLFAMGVDGVVMRDNRVYVSDLPWVSQKNGVGPAQRDRSNGEQGSTDGRTLTLAGVTYAKGVGVHAASELVIDLVGGGYSRFKSDIGVDDETASAGSVVFSVYADGELLFTSGTMKGASATRSVDVSVEGRQQLRLVVGDAGDGGFCDHADWADARLE
ncbi:NPCBM/NEW2 domain-containing protein [Archangium violaceum]|uniref:NPCBM/NEW2 domain-containing protein n=1 Tax=Archangium violaceum TaxID=83451 RepID=UPI001950A4B9|nr:NPCBM/NEW2 domain-containing protein [Archangium violaceum]QRN95561.1 NPCBM/NEW2 domain-containing protein [Archangium violaceum]